MKSAKVCCLIMAVALSACSQASYEQAAPVVMGAYNEVGSPARLRYYKRVLSPEKWREEKVLNYSEGYFYYPPLSGYRILHYRNPRTQTQIDLHREIVNGDTFLTVIRRRGATDHCRFTRTLYHQLQDIDIVEVNADHYIWLYGDYLCKYYFVKAGEIIYTFRLLSPAKQYPLDEPEFDYFVKDNIRNYLLYSPRRQPSPVPTAVAVLKARGKQKLRPFSKRELLSFFAPVAALHTLPQ